MKLLEKMLKTPSVSGSELHFQKMLIEEMKDVDDFVITHHSYNVIHGINKESDVKVMLLAHIDEIGLVIEEVLPNGICKMTNIGSIRPEMYMGQQVYVVKYVNGKPVYVNGVIGYTPNYKNGNVSVLDLNLDLGTTSKEETLKLVSIGDVVIQKDTYACLENDCVTSRALDDKIGAYIACEVLKRTKGKTNNGVYFCATVGEETTGRGAIFSTSTITPTCTISLDVGSASDVNYNSNANKNISLSGGPMLSISSHANQLLKAKLEEVAKKHNIPLQYVVEISRTYTDFDNVYKQNGGIPSMLISIPLRYMHSSVEVCSMKDVEYIIELLVHFIIEINESTNFDPFKE